MQTLQSSRSASPRLTSNTTTSFTSATTFPTLRDASALHSAGGELPDYNTLVDANHIESRECFLFLFYHEMHWISTFPAYITRNFVNSATDL